MRTLVRFSRRSRVGDNLLERVGVFLSRFSEMQPSLLFTTKFSFWEEPVVNSNPTCCKSLRKFTEFLSEVEKGMLKLLRSVF